MYRCEFFILRELVPPGVFESRGETAWELFDDRALMTLDRLRREFGPVIVNNWHSGGDRKWSGLRTQDSPYYSPTSQHTFGRAFDCLFADHHPRYVIDWIMKNQNEQVCEFITAVEDVEDWLHFDTRNCRRIKFFRP